jgi:hypothetical protein
MAWFDDKYEEMRSEGRRVVATRSDWARVLGTTTAAWLSQALFTQSRAGAGRWWFKKLLADRDQHGRIIPPESEVGQSFEFETGLTRTQQENARALLKKLGILCERRAKWQRRLEYMINLDCLCNLSREWAHEERNVALSATQENTSLKGESYAQESEIPRSSTKSIQNFKDRSRTSIVATPGRQTRNRSNEKHRALVAIENNIKLTVEAGGIHCWNYGDRARAKSILERFGEEKIRVAVNEVEEASEVPYPSTVARVLYSTTIRSAVEQTSELLKTYDSDKHESDNRAAARKCVRMLSISDRRTFLPIFIEKQGSNYTTSFHSITGKFLNPGEKLHFDRWLETHFMASGRPSA